MVKYGAFVLFYLSIVWIVSSCSSSTVEPDAARLGYTYFPLEEKSFAIYEVEETIYSLTSTPVTRNYQIKEVIAEQFRDLSNEEAFKVMRYSRQNTTADWELDSVWVAKRTANRAIRTENNRSFVKLIFPVEESQKWNGNVLNELGADEYEFSQVAKPFTIANQPYTSTATVMQVNDSSACNMKRVYEVYAQDIGLIYKEKILVDYRQTNNICEGLGDIQAGVQLYQKLLNYGKE
ncbi:hypothetical protein Q0590_12855 [Rhodocytophaga aerolata]|uniref:Lipoprotein n=1 Tax=Rhodocytophaga aerolata TaxID=455078 RepID=A0ABT8R4X0_9BACT|nr:hypothetical protein [Rhodocytophaga aerolata]MDO1447151.1 hypothetical protein [Rhodocytophaga aerolata]